MKNFLLKIIDIAGLSFLAPVVRLCTGEEVDKQLKEIGRMVVIPLLAFVAFLIIWHVGSDSVQTKSGKLPNPAQVSDAADRVWELHRREQVKALAFRTETGASSSWYVDLTAELDAETQQREVLTAEVAELDAAFQLRQAEALAPLEAATKAMRDDNRARKKARKEAIATFAAGLAADDEAGKEHLLVMMAEADQLEDAEKAAYNALKEEKSIIENKKDDALVTAQMALTASSERVSHLQKMLDLLTEDNRSVEAEGLRQELAALQMAYAGAGGDKALGLAKDIHKTEARLNKVEEQSFAKTATLPFQIKRSVLCTMLGFVVGTLIAVPVGILCGLNKSFMCAVTPFIALFKPVSPIIWALVFLIIVTGVIGDPDKNPLLQLLWDLPLIGKYEINPAFIGLGPDGRHVFAVADPGQYRTGCGLH